MPSVDEVILWKAPQPGRMAETEIRFGFDPQTYPGDGPYFALDRDLAKEWQQVYRNGMQEIYLARARFEEFIRQGVIQFDIYYPGQSCHVPPAGLPLFNEAIRQGTANVYHAEVRP
jgi:hypothetical protein